MSSRRRFELVGQRGADQQSRNRRIHLVELYHVYCRVSECQVDDDKCSAYGQHTDRPYIECWVNTSDEMDFVWG